MIWRQSPLWLLIVLGGLHTPTFADNLKTIKGQAGYWRLAKDEQSRWWFIDPQGKQQVINLVTSVQPFQLGKKPEDPKFVSPFWDGGTSTKGDELRWATETVKAVTDAGFTGVGAWSHQAIHKVDVPTTQDLNLVLHQTSPLYEIFDQDWADRVEKNIVPQVVPLRENKNLIGYYPDNEIPWESSYAASTFFILAKKSGREEVVKVIQSIWKSPEQFSQEWLIKPPLKSFEQLLKLKELPYPSEPRERANKVWTTLDSNWKYHLAHKYFSTVIPLIKKHDPHHLVLGVRYAGYVPPEVARASKDFLDANSLNVYEGSARISKVSFYEHLYQETELPIIVSEYGTHHVDISKGYLNRSRFQAQVPDEKAKADAIFEFNKNAFSLPFVTGTELFQWNDEPPKGRGDGEDWKSGVVDLNGHASPLVVNAVRRVKAEAGTLHQNSDTFFADPDHWNGWVPEPQARSQALSFQTQTSSILSDESFFGSCHTDPLLGISKLSAVEPISMVGAERACKSVPEARLVPTEHGVFISLHIPSSKFNWGDGEAEWAKRDLVTMYFSDGEAHSKTLQTSFNPKKGLYEASQMNRGDHFSKPTKTTRKFLSCVDGDSLTLRTFVPYSTFMEAQKKSLNQKSPQRFGFNFEFHQFESGCKYSWGGVRYPYSALGTISNVATSANDGLAVQGEATPH